MKDQFVELVGELQNKRLSMNAMLNEKHAKPLEISPVSLMFPHGTRVRSSMDEEG
jgi:hypothetical protein